jgi:hypothetical protein
MCDTEIFSQSGHFKQSNELQHQSSYFISTNEEVKIDIVDVSVGVTYDDGGKLIVDPQIISQYQVIFPKLISAIKQHKQTNDLLLYDKLQSLLAFMDKETNGRYALELCLETLLKQV